MSVPLAASRDWSRGVHSFGALQRCSLLTETVFLIGNFLFRVLIFLETNTFLEHFVISSSFVYTRLGMP